MVDLPGVGANLIDHASVWINLTTRNEPTTADPPYWQVVLCCTAPGSSEENDLQIALFSTGQQPASRLRASLMRPRSRGTLRLTSTSPHDPPDIRLNLASDPEDERRLIEAARLPCTLASTEILAEQHTDFVTLEDGRGFGAVDLASVASRPLGAAEAFAALDATSVAAEYVRRTVSHYVHPVGTARMGPVGDDGAVVDQYGRVHGVEGLRIADASIMPNVPRANTNLTCIMIGERIAEWMRLE
jgi:choline dehydrogenase